MKKIKEKKTYYETNRNNIDLIANHMMSDAKRRAKKHNLPININVDYIKNIYPKNNKCPYLNIALIRGVKKSCPTSPTLDRIDPDKGYVVGNVEIISMKANCVKNNATPDELEKVAKRLRKMKKNG